jgi:SAM-dependent methyltransferase
MSSTLPPLSPNAWLRWDLVSRRLPADAVDVLEVGCGQGAMGARLAHRYPRYVGLEPDTASYAVAAARIASIGGRGEVRNGDLIALSSDETFDLVCAFEVIEHIEDDRDALSSWIKHLRPGGWLVLSTPADQHRFAAADVMAGHFRRYDPPVMAELLRDIGLTEVEVTRFGAPLGFALEAFRNAVGRRRNAREKGVPIAERTGGSGRLLQPRSRSMAYLTEYGTLPFRLLQRVLPDRGVGLVAWGRLPR